MTTGNLKTAIKIELVVYCLMVLFFTVIGRKAQSEASCVLMPFSSWSALFSVPFQSHGQYILKEIIVNMLMMFPIGFMFGIYGAPRMVSCLIFGILFSVCIELAQYITQTGLCEMDDVIHNTIGCVVGFLTGRALSPDKYKGNNSADNSSN